jgi:nucleotide-binding universal stress UspA family protein
VTYLPEGSPAGREAQALAEQLSAAQGNLLQAAQDYLAGVAERLRARGVRLRARVATFEQPAVGILQEAEALGVGLIALATHGRRGLARLFLGSVADKVVRGATVPVLVHRGAGPDGAVRSGEG